MRSSIIILFLLFAFSCPAQNVTITGRTNRPNTLVRLMTVDDLLNMHETLAAETSSDEQGFFILEGDVAQTMPANIYVGLEPVDFIVTPDASYDITITVPDTDPSLSYFDRPLPALRVRTATDKGIYRQSVISEEIINDYVLSYFDEIYRRRQYRYLDSIRATIDTELQTENEYVLQSNTYKIASIQMALNADGGKKVIRDFYDGQPVLYHCQPYMDLFKDLFKNFEATKEFASRNPELTDLINLYQLRSLYYSDSESRSWVRKQLKSISTHSKSPEIKSLVANLETRLDRFAEGSPAPDFELQAADGTTVRLSDYKNTMVLLQFVEGNSQTVDHQFATLNDLHRQWGDSVQLITVTTKDQLASHKKRFEEHRYDWPLLDLGNDILLLERYEVRTFPEYFILLPDTKIGMAPAPSPEQTLKNHVTRLYKRH